MHIADAIDAADVIEDAYNERLRGSHVYIRTKYLEALERVNRMTRIHTEARHDALQQA